MGAAWSTTTRNARRKIVTQTLAAADYFQFTDSDLADFLGVKRGTVRRWRAGGLLGTLATGKIEAAMGDLVNEAKKAREGVKVANPNPRLRNSIRPFLAPPGTGKETTTGATGRTDQSARSAVVPPTLRVLYDFAHRLDLAQWADLFRSLATERTGGTSSSSD